MTKPGLYWGQFESYSPDTDNMPWAIFVVQHNNVAKLLQCSDWRYPLGSDAKVKIRFGPRIPTAAEIEEQGKWTRNPLCPYCGGIFHYIDDAYGECHRCGNHYEIETQYKVGKQG